MSWSLFCIFIAVAFSKLLTVCHSMRLAPVYWNSSNPMFKVSNRQHVISVNIGDSIDFVCPYSTSTDTTDHQYYIVYKVSEWEYRNCMLAPDNKASMIVNCSNPRQRKRFTINFDIYGAIPDMDFKRGGTYYYITTSIGNSPLGLMNTLHGACWEYNMKLTVQVCCDPTTTLIPSPATEGLSSHSSSPPPVTSSATSVAPTAVERITEGVAGGGVDGSEATTTTRRPTRPMSTAPVTASSTSRGHMYTSSTKFHRKPTKSRNEFPEKDRDRGRDNENKNYYTKDSENETSGKHEGLIGKARTLTTSAILLACSLLITLNCQVR